MKGKKCNIEIMGFGEGSNKLNYDLIAEHLTQIVMTNIEKYQLDLHLQATTSVPIRNVIATMRRGSLCLEH